MRHEEQKGFGVFTHGNRFGLLLHRPRNGLPLTVLCVKLHGKLTGAHEISSGE